jgi:hypothetical protein
MMQLIGQIKLVQIQRASLKAGQRPHAYYDPAALLEVARLRLTPAGARGVTADGHEFVDVHNSSHPNSKQRTGENELSFGFTSHYQAMRAEFGPHLTDGCAGENILIESERIWRLSDLGTQLAIERADGSLVRLANLLVAAPCVEFSRFAQISDRPLAADELRATLQFLNDGMRGFYARLAEDQDDAIVQAGDLVYVGS